MGLKISKVELKKSGKEVFIQFEQSAVQAQGGELVDSDNKILVKKEPHADFVNRFIKMVPHLMFLAQFHTPEAIGQSFFDDYVFTDDSRFKGVNVTAIVVSGKEQDIITLVGTKTTSKKEVINFNSPPVWLNDTAENRYELLDILKSNFTGLIDESEKFFKGKYAVESQAALF